MQVQVRDNPFRTAAPFQAPGEREPAEVLIVPFMALPDAEQHELLRSWLERHPDDLDDMDEITVNFNRYELSGAVLLLNNPQLGLWLRDKVNAHFAARIDAEREAA